MLERTPQAFINACATALWNSGYSTLIDDDLHSWVEFLSRVNPGGIVNAEANPDFHRLEPDNSFWIAVRKRTGNRDIIACICQRMIETDDFLELQRSLKLWYGDDLDGRTPFELALPRDAYPDIKGKVGHPAGLFVAPEERHSGLAWLLQRMVCGHFPSSVGRIWDGSAARPAGHWWHAASRPTPMAIRAVICWSMAGSSRQV